MALLRRESARPDVLVAQGRDMVARTARAHQARWGLGTAERAELDRDAGVLRWTFRDHVVTAPVQVLARRSAAGTSWAWEWAWADETVPRRLRVDSEAVRLWGTEHRYEPLTLPALHGLTARKAADLAALSFVITRATGFYRVPTGSAHLYLTFGPVTIVDSDGRPRPFTIDLGRPVGSAQRSWTRSR